MDKYSELKDAQLMTLYKQGEEAAFEELFNRHQAKVYGYLMKRLNNAFEVQEVFQSVFMRFHKAKERYDNKFPLEAWLFTICKNTLIDFYRAQGVQNKYVRYNSDELPDIADETVVDDKLDELDLSALNDRQKQAIEMRYKEDFSFDQIAKAMNTSPANARKLISRGIHKLKSILIPQGDGNE